MSVDQKDVIDFVSIDADNNLVLTISDHLAWDSTNEHLLKLQEKINTYLKFIESGEIYQKYPHDRGRNVVIKVASMFEIDADSRKVFMKFQKVVRDAGFDLRIERLSSLH